MTSTSNFQTAVIPTTSTSSNNNSPTLSPTDVKVLYYASPSYNNSYGEPAPILATRYTWQNITYGIIFITIGLIEIFYGYKLIRITLLIMGFLFWSSTSVIILLLLDNSNKIFRSAIYYFMVWLSSGTLGGLLSYWCWHLGLILTSSYGGFTFIITILTLISISIDILRYFIISFFILLPPILVYKYERQFVNVTTSIAGSYTFFCGVDEFIHQGYREMIQFTRYEGSLRFIPTTTIYIMVVLTILLAALGIAFEYKYHEEPFYNFWCGDKSRRDKQLNDNNQTIGQNSNLLLIKIINLIVNIKSYLKNLLIKMRIIKGDKNNKNTVEQVDSNPPDTHVIEIDNIDN